MRARVGGRDFAALPHHGNAADKQRAHQHHGQRPVGGIEHADHTLVAREQPRYVFCRDLVDAEQRAGHMHGFAQRSCYWHVNTVVVERRQVDGSETPTTERLGACSRTEQGFRRIAVALGLQQVSFFDGPCLADAAIDRADQRRFGSIDGACISAQGTGEEVIEGGVLRHLRALCLAEVHLRIEFQEALDERTAHHAVLYARQPVNECRGEVLRQHVLQGDKQPVRHARRGNSFGQAWRVHGWAPATRR